MPYVAPTTKSANTVLTSAEWNVIVNDVIDLNLRAPTRGTYAARPVAPAIGDFYYQTDTEELIKYVTDLDGTARWMSNNQDPNRNLVINGSFNVWQRGTSFNPTSVNTLSGNNYGVDRWQMLQLTNRSVAFSQFAIGISDPAGYNFCTRVGRQSGDTFVTPFIMQTSFESRNLRSVRNKYVTLSFWAKAGASYSAASSFLTSQIVRGIGTDGTVGNFTSDTPISFTDHVLTTSWKRFTVTTAAVVPTTTNQLGIKFTFTPTGTAGASDYFDITGVQLETGTAPSDFEFLDIGEELARCQRYYYQMGPSSASLQTYGAGFMNNATTANLLVSFPQTMRTATTTMTTSGIPGNYAVATANLLTTVTSNPSLNVASDRSAFVQFIVTTALTAGQGCLGLNNSSTTGFLGFSSEL